MLYCSPHHLASKQTSKCSKKLIVIRCGTWAWCMANLAVDIARLGWCQQHQVVEKLPQCSSRQRKGDCSGIPPTRDHQPGQAQWQIGFPFRLVNVSFIWCWGSRTYWTWDAAISSCSRICSSQFDRARRLPVYHRNAQRLVVVCFATTTNLADVAFLWKESCDWPVVEHRRG